MAFPSRHDNGCRTPFTHLRRVGLVGVQKGVPSVLLNFIIHDNILSGTHGLGQCKCKRYLQSSVPLVSIQLV